MSIYNNNKSHTKKIVYLCDYCGRKGHLENFCIKKKNDIIQDLTLDLNNINVNDDNSNNSDDNDSPRENVVIHEKTIYNYEKIEFGDEQYDEYNKEREELVKYFKTLETVLNIEEEIPDVEKKCKFCEDYNKNMNTDHDINHYTKHPIDNTIVLCPLLANNVCKYCKLKGHTPRFCPKSFNDNFLKNSYSQFLKNKNNTEELEFIFRF